VLILKAAFSEPLSQRALTDDTFTGVFCPSFVRCVQFRRSSGGIWLDGAAIGQKGR
jgi:hypothetical protein